jgi:hypothetical protein
MRGENKVDMVGQKFGRLLILSAAKSRHGRAYWNCVCDCGKLCKAMGRWVRQGKKRSCGCLQRESNQINAAAMHAANNLPPGEAAFNLLFASYRCSAAARDIQFNLTKADVSSLTKQNCFYCGAEPKTAYALGLPNGGYVYNGVDRKDSLLGYDLENCVACCKMCNWMKNKFTVEEFLSKCAAITNHQRRQVV